MLYQLRGKEIITGNGDHETFITAEDASYALVVTDILVMLGEQAINGRVDLETQATGLQVEERALVGVGDDRRRLAVGGQQAQPGVARGDALRGASPGDLADSERPEEVLGGATAQDAADSED